MVVVIISILYIFLYTLIYVHSRGAYFQGISEAKKKIWSIEIVAEDLFEEKIFVR